MIKNKLLPLVCYMVETGLGLLLISFLADGLLHSEFESIYGKYIITAFITILTPINLALFLFVLSTFKKINLRTTKLLLTIAILIIVTGLIILPFIYQIIEKFLPEKVIFSYLMSTIFVICNQFLFVKIWNNINNYFPVTHWLLLIATIPLLIWLIFLNLLFSVSV